ncbi:DUF4148 domain-containing protein [Paraburkholderia sp. J94]|uniref:DUF4148 domain-containing protein n=1 Tax=Paraburkholderia sp. J94 TaxID=2805441 RepID=UPI002AB0D5A5|nr:DUF4148 domain-containing protein [Paraburkholderia sp. J94]
MKAKFFVSMIVAAAMLPSVVFAQSHDPVSRAEVKAQIVQAEHDGTLHPSNTRYPDPAIRAQAPTQNDSGYGMTSASYSESGASAAPMAVKAIYEHH